MGTNGIDVSEYQHGTDITKMPGLDFVIAKACQGSTNGGGFEDTVYGEWAEQTEAAGAHFGAYCYFRPELLNARAQADYFCAVSRPRSGLSLWIDYETYGISGQHDAEEIGFFAAEVKRNTGNRGKIGIYCDDFGLNRILPYLAEIPYSALWNADPSRGMTVQNPSLAWQVHQYETLDNIDRDYSTWSRADWESFWTW